ncbi:MAG: histidine kinase [Bifidobacteriaceae bacterium]|nr:histidine kinase [Bifidobacteriaceae bacterium]
MERATDKAMVLALCLMALGLHGIDTVAVVVGLIALIVACLYELPVLPPWVRWALPLGLLALGCLGATCTCVVPLAVYDLARRRWWLGLLGLGPLLVAHPHDKAWFGALVVLGVIAGLLAWRTGRVLTTVAAFRALRDDLTDQSRSLQARHRHLRDRHELEVRLATLGERARIAREIHDNVGHLLTRSVLQVEALQVVHAADDALAAELGQVGETLHTAFDTVRASVHGLHDDALDLGAQLRNLAEAAPGLEVAVAFEADAAAMPPAVAAAFLAIAREALANTERHSDATRVRLSVVEFPGLYQLSVQDNGTKAPRAGGGPDNKGRRDGIGLAGMEERVLGLGGVFRAGFDHGFKVWATVPKETP